MARIQGYSEDDVDLLVADFAKTLQAAALRTTTRVATGLGEPVTASVHVFHLPGKHDQRTHGRSRQRDMKVLPPGGGGGQWQSSDDIDVRSSNLWAESRDGQRAIMETMRNMHDGKFDATEGVDVDTPWLRTYSGAIDFTAREEYGTDALKDDIFNAASRLDARLESAPTVHSTLHRGMRVQDPERVFSVGAQFDSDISSWTTHEGHAREYASHATFKGTSVMMHIGPGSRGVNIDDGSLHNQRGSGEHLLRGTFKITGAQMGDDGVFHVDVEQLWLPS